MFSVHEPDEPSQKTPPTPPPPPPRTTLIKRNSLYRVCSGGVLSLCDMVDDVH